MAVATFMGFVFLARAINPDMFADWGIMIAFAIIALRCAIWDSRTKREE